MPSMGGRRVSDRIEAAQKIAYERGVRDGYRRALRELSDTLREIEGQNKLPSDADLSIPIEKLGLSGRIVASLKRANVKTLGELVEKTESELLDMSNFGPTSLSKVVENLSNRGLELRRHHL